MKVAETRTVTLLLQDLAGGDKSALDGLIPLVYNELRKIADGYLRRERQGHTLQPTALVHELYARMLGQEQPGYRNRGHFLGIAAQVMRQILIDPARRQLRLRYWQNAQRVDLDGIEIALLEKDVPKDGCALLSQPSHMTMGNTLNEPNPYVAGFEANQRLACIVANPRLNTSNCGNDWLREDVRGNIETPIGLVSVVNCAQT